ncbi:VWA domain-containing protein [soil metagenome]
MTDCKTTLTVNAAWERSVLGFTRDDTALMLTISAQRLATAGRTSRAAIDIAFVLDRSTSMDGEKIELVKEAVNKAIDHLGPDDRVALVTFDNEIEIVQSLSKATVSMRAAIRQKLRHIHARGNTNLSDGWLTGCGQLAEHAHTRQSARLQRAILLTDGQANAGIVDPGELAKHATALRLRGISTTTMGVGYGFDEVLLSAMAEAGGGNFKYIAHPDEFAAFFEREIGGLTQIAALRPQIEITLPQGLRAHLLNMFPSQRQGKTITVDLRDLIDQDTVDLIFEVTHRGNLGPSSSRVKGQVRAVDPEDGSTVGSAIEIPDLTFAPDAEAVTAPRNHVVGVARAYEQSLLDQREALRLDREGRYLESRKVFMVSHSRLRLADEEAAASGYAGMSDSKVRELRQESARFSDLASAPQAPLGEQVHKERTAFRGEHSRGGRRGQSST